MLQGKRAIGAAIVLAVLAPPIASLALDWRLFQGGFVHLGYALVGVGGLISLLNLYLSILRPLLLQRRRRIGEQERHISGIPMLGMLVLPGLYLAQPSIFLSVLVLVFVTVDTGNAAWFVWATWNDDGLWGREGDG